ncbi:c7f847a8-1c79-495e-ac67-422e63c3708b [Thermothielavioides terrestris]|uniref:C7f847a8-1c79-495e-ac67-422e63c3708b n=1 Tax=Thermothielavioides terrestris TaxID=2587410 RepID=A0A446BFY6_9PEZI|nr:c7f847a8-1c79-495e-ac67-422e63c3708b [Thermothielavioides terrestris]
MKCGTCHADWMRKQGDEWRRIWEEDLLPRAKNDNALRRWLSQAKSSKELAFHSVLIPQWERDTEKGFGNSIYDAYPYQIQDIKKVMLRHIEGMTVHKGKGKERESAAFGFSDGSGYSGYGPGCLGHGRSI